MKSNFNAHSRIDIHDKNGAILPINHSKNKPYYRLLTTSSGLLILCFLAGISFTTQLFAQIDQPLYQCAGVAEEQQPTSNINTVNCNNSIINFWANHMLELVPASSTRKLKINLNIIFVQNASGIGNFQLNDPNHLTLYNNVVNLANKKLSFIEDISANTSSCTCNTQPDFFPSTYIEIIPHYIEVKSDYYFDHMNDPAVNGIGAISNTSRPFMKEIVQLAKLQPGFAFGGINWIVTNHGDATLELLNSPVGVAHWNIPSYWEPFHGNVYADLPSFSFTKDMIIHVPDGYLKFLGYMNFHAPNNEWWINDDWLPATGQLMAHEILHFLDLIDITGQTCPENLMNNNGSNDAELKKNLTGCQLRKIFQSIHTKTSRTALVCENALETEIVVDQNETWLNNLRIIGDVVIKDGYTLTVTCEVHMSPKGRIIVERGGKLIVDGGLLTGDCSDMWKGIVVEGDVPGFQTKSGIVELKNSAIIENAKDAISMNPTHRPWSDTYQSYFGGIVRAENSTIRNCHRGVEFMRYGYGGIKDLSFFKNTTFENLHEGITNWANDGVSFDHCTFNKIERRAIHPYDSEVIIKNGTSFVETLIGVDALSTYPIIFSSIIGTEAPAERNNFNCQLYGIHVKAGGNSIPLSIRNNDFTFGTVGFHQDGNGQFNLENNIFTNLAQGSRFYDCGYNQNIVRINRFEANSIGTNSNKNNTGLMYKGNCFQSNSNVDINNQNGGIFPLQGSLLEAAGNCFEGPETDINNKTGYTLYYTVQQNTPPTSCKYPQNPQLYNYSILPNSESDLYENCSNFPVAPPTLLCNFSENLSIEELKIERQQIVSQLNEILIQDVPGNWEIDYIANKHRYCLQKIDDLIGKKYFTVDGQVSQTDKEAAIDYFNGCGDFANMTTAYGIMVAFGEYQRARAFINTYPASNNEEKNFKWVQGINLDYLESFHEYSLSEENKLLMRQIGESEGPYNGYARALYEVLTNERIEVKFAEIDDTKNQERNGFTSSLHSISVYPNPVRNGKVIIEGPTMGDTLSPYLELTDLNGYKWVCSTSITGDNKTIDVSLLPTGLYMLKIINHTTGELQCKKIIIIN